MSKTIREQLIAGLIELGFEENKESRTRRDVYRKRLTQAGLPEYGKNWYVGKGGSLRIGRTVAEARPATPTTREYVMTALKLRPLIRKKIEELNPDLAKLGTPEEREDLARTLASGDSDLLMVSFRTVLLHVNTWYREGLERFAMSIAAPGRPN